MRFKIHFKWSSRHLPLASWMVCGLLVCGCDGQNREPQPNEGMSAVVQPASGEAASGKATSEEPANDAESNQDAGSQVAADSPFKEKQEEEKMGQENQGPKFNPLTEFEQWVILKKGTERPFVGEYTDNKSEGTYVCRRCNAPLYESSSKFESDCGWPSFDDEIKGAVDRHLDADGYRVEIVCKNCGGHLGHVFEGEGFTAKNIRHCVNSVSMKFYKKGEPLPEVIKP